MLYYNFFMTTQQYSLQRLSELTELTARTIRSYISQGLLDGPDQLGRYAKYTDAHLKRLESIMYMTKKGKSFQEIGELLLALGHDAILSMRDNDEVIAEKQNPETASRTTSDILDYIRDWKDAAAGARTEQPAKSQAGTKVEPTGLDRLLDELQKSLGSSFPEAKTKTRAQEWTQVDVTPDIRLSVRGKFSDNEKVRLTRIADALRRILIGGTKT